MKMKMVMKMMVFAVVKKRKLISLHSYRESRGAEVRVRGQGDKQK